MLRKLYRSALDHELGVVGAEIERTVSMLGDIDIKLEALVKRFDKLQNRAVMQTARQAQRREQDMPYVPHPSQQVKAFDPEDPATWGDKTFG